MATKQIGLSPEFVIHPGETIAEVLEERGISQLELATCTDTSTAYVSNVISGKKAISSRFAFALEYVLGVPKTFWLNLQANYEAELLELQECQTISDDEKAVYKKLGEIVNYLGTNGSIPENQDIENSILSLRKALRISNIANLDKCIPQNSPNEKPTKKINEYALGAWVRICQTISLSKTTDYPFHKDNINNLIRDIDKLSDLPDMSRDGYSDFFSSYGVEYSFIDSFSDVPVDGYILKRPNGSYFIAVTDVENQKQKRMHALVNEIKYIMDGRLARSCQLIDYSENPRTNASFLSGCPGDGRSG